MLVEGRERTVDVHVPPDTGKGSPGVTYMIDGVDLNDNMRMRGETGIEDLTKNDNMVIVYLHALKKDVPGSAIKMNAWNSQRAGVTDWDKSYDDSNYFTAVMNKIDSSMTVDKSRQYIYAFGEGGEVANELRAEHPHSFAGLIEVMPTVMGNRHDHDHVDPAAVVISLSQSRMYFPPEGGQGYLTGKLSRVKESQPQKVFTDALAENQNNAPGSEQNYKQYHDDTKQREVRESTNNGAPVKEWTRDYKAGHWYTLGATGGQGRYAIDGPGQGGFWYIGEKDRSGYDVTAESLKEVEQYRLVNGKLEKAQ
jgi:poly(3-hydroxybutyrate) depolymerase